MKKQFLALAFAAIALVNVQAQEGLEVGAHIGFPVGDISNTHSFNFGVDAAYRVEVIDNLKVGGAIAFDHFVGKDIEGNGAGTSKFANVSFLPIAASATYHFADPFYAGLDLGYAVSLSSDVDGGFYAQPKIGYDFDQFTFFGFYKNITSRNKYVVDGRNFVDKASAGSIGIGAAYKF